MKIVLFLYFLIITYIASFSATLYSYQSGNWNSATSWTTDPSGTTQVGAAVPVNSDIIYILTGRTITLSANVATRNHQITINSGATLDFGAFSFNRTIVSLSGTGTLRKSTTGFPTVTTNNFITASGGTIVYYGNGPYNDFGLPSYNNIRLDMQSPSSTVTFITTTITIYGSFVVAQGVAQLNNTANTARTFTINGDIDVDINGSITTGTGNASHSLTLGGNLTNNGSIRFTNQASPVQNSYYTTATTTGSVNLIFRGTSNVSLICNGITDLYQLTINKGTDQTPVLTINSTNAAYFALYGPNNSATLSQKALYLRNGTLKLQGSLNIPSLSEGGIDFVVPATAALWIDGATVSGTIVGLNGTGYQAVSVYGRLKISSGNFSTGDAAGLVYWNATAPDLIIDGGVLDISQVWYASGTGNFNFMQSGGTINIRANGENHAGPMLNIPSTNAVFIMSGGTINFINGIFTAGQGMDLRCSNSNFSVTGGTININLPGGTNFGINSSVPFYNITASRQSGTGNTTVTLLNTSSSLFTVLGNLSLNANTLLDAGTNTVNFTSSGSFTIETGATYTPGTTTLTFNGNTAQQFNNSGTITTALNNLTIDKNTSSLTLGGSATTFPINGILTITSGTINDGGKTIDLKGNIVNSGTHTGTGKILLSGTALQSIGGNGNGVFQNIELNNSNAAPAPISFIANQTINGAVTFTSAKLLNIATYSLSLGSNASFTNADANKYIQTSATIGSGGITKTFSSTSFTYPFGSSAGYTPCTITFSQAPNVYGSLNVKNINSEHPNVTATGRSLTYYWKLTSSGFDLGSATVTKDFTYLNSSIASGGDVSEAEYVPACFNPSSYTWSNTTTADINTAINLLTFQGVTFNTIIDGEYTAGDNNPTNPFGSVMVYYSRDVTAGAGIVDWNLATTWSTDPILQHAGAAAATPPTSTGAVLIKVGHQITTNSISRTCGTLTLNGTLDIGTGGSNFTSLSGTGKLRLSNTTLPSTDFTVFTSSSGGTIEYYRNGGDITIPTGLTTYNNLLVTTVSGASGTINFPNANFTINGNLEIGNTSDAGTLYVNTSTSSSNTINVLKDFSVTGISGTNTTFFTLSSGGNQTLNVYGNIVVSANATFRIAPTGAAQTHVLNLYANVSGKGNLTNNGTLDFYITATGIRQCNVYFLGSYSSSVTGTGAITDFNNIYINKGSSASSVLDVNLTALTFQGGTTYSGINLSNGTFRLSSSQTINYASADFTIPSTACLSANGGILQQTAGNLFLNGQLEVLNGTINIGTGATDNNIEYAASGTPTIIVQGSATLNVRGQIRRNAIASTGALVYSQSGTSNVTVGISFASTNNRGVFEIANNPGSSFTMSGGTLTLVRPQGTPSIAALFLQSGTSNVTGGTIQIGNTSTAAGQTFDINLTSPIWNLVVDATTQTKTVRLSINPITIKGNLTINGNSVFNTNGLNVTISGNLLNNNNSTATGLTSGGFIPAIAGQTTTFDSSTGNQSITGAGTNVTNFANLTVSNTFSGGSVTLSANTKLYISSTFIISSGTFNDGGNIVSCNGNISNFTTHTSSGAGKITLIGTASQTILGGGAFGNLDVNNTNTINVTSNISINGILSFTSASAIFDMGVYNLLLGSSASITGYSATKRINTSGASSDGGISKIFAGSLAGASFTYPISGSGKYVPVTFTISTGATGGTATVKPVNALHPNATGAGADYINYYWNMSHTIVNLTSLTHTYTYQTADITGTEANMRDARFVSSSWTVGTTAGNPNTGTNVISFTNTDANGDYTCGIATKFINPTSYTSNVSSGTWENATSWTPSGPPSAGANVTILSGHTITVGSNSKVIGSLTINGILDLGITTSHNFGTVTGTGVLRITTASGYFVFPGGNYSTFVNVGGGTIEYYDATASTPTQPVYNNLVFTGTGVKTMVDMNSTINGNLSVRSGELNIGGYDFTAAATGNDSISGKLNFTSTSGTKTFGNLLIMSGGTWKNDVVNEDITIAANFTNNGFFYSGSGIYTFTGSNKLIDGGSLIDNINVLIDGTYKYNNTSSFSQFNTLTINNAGDIFTINNQRGLTVNNAFIDNGYLLIDAGPNAYSGSFITNGSISGTGTMGFKSSISKNKWHCVSSPMTNAQIETVFSDIASYNNNFYFYNETSQSYWVQQTTGPMTVGKGFYTYYYDNKYKIYDGTFNTGNITISNLTYTPAGRTGWNFVGNPYPSAIDWDAVGWTKTNFEDAVYIKNGNGWDQYVGGIGSCRYIYPGQGFFVKALAGGGSLSFSNSVRLHRPSDYLKQNNEITDPVLKLSLTNDTLINTTYLRFKTDATPLFDKKWDAYKIFSENVLYPEIFTVSTAADSLSINSTPFTGNDTIVPLGIKVEILGNYRIKAEEILNFNQNTNIFLEDALTSIWTNLKQDSGYSFVSDTYKGNNRFFLHFTKSGNNIQKLSYENSLVVTNPYDCGGRICFVVHNFLKSDVAIELVDVNGKILYSGTSQMNNTSQLFSIEYPSLQTGYYFLKVSNPANVIAKKVCIIK